MSKNIYEILAALKGVGGKPFKEDIYENYEELDEDYTTSYADKSFKEWHKRAKGIEQNPQKVVKVTDTLYHVKNRVSGKVTAVYDLEDPKKRWIKTFSVGRGPGLGEGAKPWDNDDVSGPELDHLRHPDDVAMGEAVGKPNGMTLVDAQSAKGREAETYFIPEHDEYIVLFYIDGALQSDADYFTDDKDEALQNAIYFVYGNNASKMTEEGEEITNDTDPATSRGNAIGIAQRNAAVKAKKLTKSSFEKAGVNADQISKDKAGNIVLRKGYYYRPKYDVSAWATVILAKMKNAGFDLELVQDDDIWKPFRGGSTIARQSHYLVKVREASPQGVTEEGTADVKYVTRFDVAMSGYTAGRKDLILPMGTVTRLVRRINDNHGEFIVSAGAHKGKTVKLPFKGMVEEGMNEVSYSGKPMGIPDVDHMPGEVSGDRSPLYSRKKSFTDQAQWAAAANAVNSSKYDDNAEISSDSSGSSYSVDGKVIAKWDNRANHGVVNEDKKVASHSELAQAAHKAYVEATRQGNGTMAKHYLEQVTKHKAAAKKEKTQESITEVGGQKPTHIVHYTRDSDPQQNVSKMPVVARNRMDARNKVHQMISHEGGYNIKKIIDLVEPSLDESKGAVNEGWFSNLFKSYAPQPFDAAAFQKKLQNWKRSMDSAYKKLPRLIDQNQWEQVGATASKIKNGVRNGLQKEYIQFDSKGSMDSALKRLDAALNVKVFDEITVTPQNFAGGGTGALVGLALGGLGGAAIGGALGSARKGSKMSAQELAIMNAHQRTNTLRQDNKAMIIARIEKFYPAFMKILSLPPAEEVASRTQERAKKVDESADQGDVVHSVEQDSHTYTITQAGSLRGNSYKVRKDGALLSNHASKNNALGWLTAYLKRARINESAEKHDTYGWSTKKVDDGYEWQVTGVTYQKPTAVLAKGKAKTRPQAVAAAKKAVMKYRKPAKTEGKE